MKKLHLNLDSDSYDIIICDGLLSHLSFYVEKVYTKRNIFIITDSNVSGFYLETVTKQLENKYHVEHVIVKAGEDSKSLKVYEKVVKELFDKNIRRGDLLVALGGGVIGDLTGFVSSTIFRGTPYISIPTSLLSMMDSSIGGKTGIDFDGRKNVIGCFHQPKLVLIDIDTLKTLPTAEYINGSAELIKHAIIYDKDLFDELSKNKTVNEDIILKSLQVKEHFVVNDVYDEGIRMVLNFGHTFGHIVEVEYGYRHGEAVALGMLMALDYGIDLGISKKSDRLKIKNILEYFGLPTKKYDYKKYLKLIFEDKKNIAGDLNFILIDRIGSSVVKVLNENE